MAFSPATYNITLLGPLTVQRLPTPNSLHFVSPFAHHNPVDMLTRLINFTETSNFESLLDPLEARQKEVTFGHDNVVSFTQQNRSHRKQSFITKRSRNSKAGQHRQTTIISERNTDSTTLDPFTFETSIDHPSVLSTTNIKPHSTTNLDSHHTLPIPLMDTRSPEHADPFESTRVQGPVAVRTSTAAPEVVTPRLVLPSPSPGALMQLPVLWTALSLALGVEVQGEIVRGLPCIKRLNQLFCRNAGTSYPSENIESFIEENKALTRRMYGEFQSDLGLGEIVESAIRTFRRGRSVGDPPQAFRPPVANRVTSNISKTLKDMDDLMPSTTTERLQAEGLWTTMIHEDDPGVTAAPRRSKRQSAGAAANSRRPTSVPSPPSSTSNNSDRLDSCNSKMEIVTPYWASNSAGKILAIVNLNEFSQVIHQEVCTRSSTKRCNGECGCEQKYKWHRMLAYDLENECKGIFVDWFLFPSCCVCRCDP